MAGVCRELLSQFIARGNFPGLQKGFDEFAFAALNYFSRSTLTCLAVILSRSRERGILPKLSEPWAVRHFRLGVQPFSQQSKLIGGNVPGFDPVEQMRKEGPGEVATLNAGHG